jgi:hypothetical protein
MLKRKLMVGRLSSMILGTAIIILVCSTNCVLAETEQMSFPSAEQAVQTLVGAVKINDAKKLKAILGPDSEELISSGDAVVDAQTRQRFSEAYEEKNSLVSQGESKKVLHLGKDDWPFPIPIIQKDKTWIFDTQAGKEELLNRRIGRNELNTIQTCLAIGDAQREYALKDLDGDGIAQYAQKFASDPGTKNGLYWQSKEGEAPSPLGDLVAEAAEEGYARKESGERTPYHGYYFRILKAQGPAAHGGEYDYVVKGNMIGGFALVAYPSDYGNSGVMTFIVNHEGVVYQKDLGPDTDKIASEMTMFDPDETWQKSDTDS